MLARAFSRSVSANCVMQGDEARVPMLRAASFFRASVKDLQDRDRRAPAIVDEEPGRPECRSWFFSTRRRFSVPQS